MFSWPHVLWMGRRPVAPDSLSPLGGRGSAGGWGQGIYICVCVCVCVYCKNAAAAPFLRPLPRSLTCLDLHAHCLPVACPHVHFHPRGGGDRLGRTPTVVYLKIGVYINQHRPRSGQFVNQANRAQTKAKSPLHVPGSHGLCDLTIHNFLWPTLHNVSQPSRLPTGNSSFAKGKVLWCKRAEENVHGCPCVEVSFPSHCGESGGDFPALICVPPGCSE